MSDNNKKDASEAAAELLEVTAQEGKKLSTKRKVLIGLGATALIAAAATGGYFFLKGRKAAATKPAK